MLVKINKDLIVNTDLINSISIKTGTRYFNVEIRFENGDFSGIGFYNTHEEAVIKVNEILDIINSSIGGK